MLLDYKLDKDKLLRVMARKRITADQIIATGVKPRTLGSWLSGEASPSPFMLSHLVHTLQVEESDILEQQ